MPVKRPKSGDRLSIPASDYRAFADAAEAVRQMAGASQAGRPSAGGQNASIVSVRNDSGSDVARFGILAITGLVVTPTDSADEFKNRIIVTGDTPSSADAGKFVVCLEPIAAATESTPAGIGSGLVAGAVQCQVEVIDENHQYADVTDADATKLTSASTGSARILWKESGTGTKWAVVRLGGNGGGGTCGTIVQIPLTAFGTEDLVALPAEAPQIDPTTYGAFLVPGTFGTDSPTIQVGKADHYLHDLLRLELPLPKDYTPRDVITLRFHAGVFEDLAYRATLDVAAHKSDEEAGVGADLCTTDQQDINDTTLADYDFEIDAEGLAAGDLLDVGVTIDGQSIGPTENGIVIIGSCTLILGATS